MDSVIHCSGAATVPLVSGSQQHDVLVAPLNDLFSLTALPAFGLDQMLDAIADYVVRSVGSNIAGCAIYYSYPDDDHTVLKLRPIRSALAAPREALIERCKANQQLFTGSASNPELTISFFEDGRVFLDFDLSENEPFFGVLRVEGFAGHKFLKNHKKELAKLARQAGILISRLLLRDHAAELNMDINLVGRSQRLLALEEQIKMIASDPTSPVLITGERGSGKELAAFALHFFSRRRNMPFIPVNTATFSENLSHDELFGHERNAFTGAIKQRAGIFKAADGGTVFMDEIAEMAPSVQASLLRVLDQGEIRQIGSDFPTKVNVRVIGATNKNLEKLVEEGSFRADLYDRLNVFQLEVPPLRGREEDIELLSSYFLRKACRENRRHVRRGEGAGCFRSEFMPGCIRQGFFSRLTQYDFPGNIRELKNLTTRLATATGVEDIRGKHLDQFLKSKRHSTSRANRDDLTLETTLRNHISRVLELAGYNKSKASRMLGLPLTTLINKMNKLGI